MCVCQIGQRCRCHDRWRRCRGAGARPTAALACCSRVRSSSRACHRRSPRSCTSCCSSGMLCSSAAQVQQQLTTAGFSSTSRSRCRRSSAELHRLHRNTSRAPRFVAHRALHGPCKLSSLDLPLQHPLGRRMSFFNLFLLLRFEVLALTISSRRDTIFQALAGCDASNMQIQFFSRCFIFCHTAGTPGGARASSGRRPSPHAQPSHPSPFFPFPPSLYSLPRPGRGCGWMWVGREGGRGRPRAHRHLFHLKFTRRSPDARPGARSTLARPHRVDAAGAAVVTETRETRSAIFALQPGFPEESVPGNPRAADLVRLTLIFYDFSLACLSCYAVCCVLTY